MERFKVTHFEAAKPGEPFPESVQLSPKEASSLRKKLAANLGLPLSADGLRLLQELQKRAQTLTLNAVEPAFDLRAVVASLVIEPQDFVFVNWYRLDKIDKLRFADLARFFRDLWYPSSDDIEIFDQTLSWIPMISHAGTWR